MMNAVAGCQGAKVKESDPPCTLVPSHPGTFTPMHPRYLAPSDPSLP